MDRLINHSDDPADIPSLGIFGVPPGESCQVPDAEAFATSEIWQDTSTRTKKAPAKPKVKPAPAHLVPKPSHDEENPK